jgi:hypothetical protein
MVEVSASGAVLSSFNFSALASGSDGVAIYRDRSIYDIAEAGPTMFVLRVPTRVPSPPGWVLAVGAAGLLFGGARRR